MNKRKRGDEGEMNPKKKAKNTDSAPTVMLDVGELMNSIIENDDDHVFILCLSGKMVTEDSTKREMRSAYRKLSKIIHPDKHKNSKESTQAFQILATAFETLTNPDAGAPKERGKDKRFTRDNKGCQITKIHCPRCNSKWQRELLGLEKPSYNFFMLGIKQYICGLCCMKFGCLTAIHFTPCCNKQFIYDPVMYDEKVQCKSLSSSGGKITKKQQQCSKQFGFFRFKVSERREKEIRMEVKKEAEKERKARAATKRRKARLNRRKPEENLTSAAEETLFIIGLKSICPRCGWELTSANSPSQHKDKAKAHLSECTDTAKIEAYQEQKKRIRKQEEEQKAKEQLVADMMILKSWEANGKQIGQLWMLPLSQLVVLCEKHGLKSKGNAPVLIKKLYKKLKKSQTLAITDGSEYKNGGKDKVKYDFCGLEHADQEDLPENFHSMELEELQAVCAGYNISYRSSDTKSDLITKLEKKRFKGLMMIKN